MNEAGASVIEVRVHKPVRHGIELYRIEVRRDGAVIAKSGEFLSIEGVRSWFLTWVGGQRVEAEREAMH